MGAETAATAAAMTDTDHAATFTMGLRDFVGSVISVVFKESSNADSHGVPLLTAKVAANPQ